MTTTVRVFAHCNDGERVRVTRAYGRDEGEGFVMRDGESIEMSVFGDWSVTVREEPDPDSEKHGGAGDAA